MKALLATGVTCAALVLATALLAAMFNLPPPPVVLAEVVAANIGQSGVLHPVTAVLLNFRGYDTLLEVAVLLLALLGVLAVVDRPNQPHAAHLGAPGAPVLQTLARLLPVWIRPGRLLRLGLVGGFLIFLAVAAALLGQGSLLQYPPPWAEALILLIEAGLSFSLGLTLAGLFLFLTGSEKPRPCPPV